MQVTGEPQPLLGGGQVGDGGAGLAQLPHGGDQPRQAGHREPAEEARQHDPDQRPGVGVDQQRDGQRQAGDQRHPGQPELRRQHGADADGHVGVERQPGLPEAEGGGGGQHHQQADDQVVAPQMAGPVGRPEGHQGDVADQEERQPDRPRHGGRRPVVTARQVADGVEQVDHPQRHPAQLHQQLAAVLDRRAGIALERATLPTLLPAVVGAVVQERLGHEGHHAVRVSLRYRYAATTTKSTRKPANPATAEVSRE